MTTDINKRILQAIELNKNITLIEISKIAIRDIRVEVLEKLQEKNIELQTVDSLKPLQVYTYRIDCFAYNNKQCTALREIDCAKCKFYKNKKYVDKWKIEEDIKKYAKNHN